MDLPFGKQLTLLDVRLPIALGVDQPLNVPPRISTIDIAFAIGLVQTARELRVPLASLDGILYTMPPPADQKIIQTWVLDSTMVTTASTALRLVVSSVLVSRLVMHAKKVDGDNTGNCFWGDLTLDQGVKEGPEVAPGESFELIAQPGEVFDLVDIYIDADNNGDGFVFNYLPA